MTLNQKYAGVCGLTHEEFDKYFTDNLASSLDIMKANGLLAGKFTIDQLRSKIFKWYDGYSWDGKTMVMNPYSIISCLSNSDFSDYWIQTNPSVYFLNKISTNNPLDLLDGESNQLPERELGMAEVGNLEPIPALFQTGYLTVDKYFSVPSQGSSYTLKIPNWEIKNFRYNIFSNNLFQTLNINSKNERIQLCESLIEKDCKKFTLIFSSLFAGLPAIHHQNNESRYFKIMYGYLNGLNCLVLPEPPIAIGTPDLIVDFPGENCAE
jgi:hypothetical protein